VGLLRLGPPDFGEQLAGWYTVNPRHRCFLNSQKEFAAGAPRGEVSERLKEHAWKACSRETGSWVRIPPSPPFRRRRNTQSESSRSESKGWFCFILECAGRSYYVGVATDVEQREKEHNHGFGRRHTRLRRPVRVVWSQACPGYAQARALKARLKGWGRDKKRLLTMGSLRLD
jgi:putative endonuclease